MQSVPRARQSGFTLVEIAIVLVIIGLLLGGVLRGQELIDSSRAKNAVADMNGVIAAYNSYIDRYRRLPGDDGPLATLTARGGAWTTAGITAGGSTGAINVAANGTFGGAGESVSFWQHLRAGGFLTGNPGTAGVAALPANAWGGLMGITNAITQGRPAATLQVCLGNVPGKSAQAIDAQIDDGLPNNGALRATVGPNNVNPGVAAATYNESLFYTICRDML